MIDFKPVAKIRRKLYGVRSVNCRKERVKSIPRAVLENIPALRKGNTAILPEVSRLADIS
jgi:hypothetical protein